MTEVRIFEFESYKAYLTSTLGAPGQRTGKRAQAAKAMGCQTAYMSQVLNGNAHLSLEQAILLSNYLGHSIVEEEYFLNIVQSEKAGNSELRAYYQNKVKEIQQQQSLIKNRVGSPTALSHEDQSRYYSKWYFAALHMLATMPGSTNREAMADILGLPLSTTSEALEFLVRIGLLIETEKGYQSGQQRMHLGNDSSNIHKHHTNWRLKSLESLERESDQDLHYSVVFSIGRNDVFILREKLLKAIQDCIKVVEKSGEEELCCLNLDLFDLKRQK